MKNKVRKHLNIFAQILREDSDIRQLFMVAIIFIVAWFIY